MRVHAYLTLALLIGISCGGLHAAEECPDGVCQAKLDGAGDSFVVDEQAVDAKTIDLTYTIGKGLPVWQKDTGLEKFETLVSDMGKGAAFYSTQLNLNVHTGTHVDAPSHFLKDQWSAENHVDKIPLDVLTGHALVLSVPAGSNITGAVLDQLAIPDDCERLLLRTSNTDRKLMQQTAFAPDYVALTADGAHFLADNTNVKLVGIDYLSIATLDDLAPGHEALFKKGIVPVEGLDLSQLLHMRWYYLTCLPLKLAGAEGAPARCIAYGPDTDHEEYRQAGTGED